MLTVADEVFDEVIKGAGPWYSAAPFDAGIGASDRYSIQAAVTAVAGTSPTLTVVAQQSSDGQRWVDGPTLISNQAIASAGLYGGAVVEQGLRYGRLKISLGGTNPTCRLSVHATGRSHSSGPIYNELVFDETVAGTTQTWKSAVTANDMLGLADFAYIMAVGENVTGTTNLVVSSEHSADGQNWAPWGTVLSANNITSGTAYTGMLAGTGGLLHYARLSVTLTGTSPQCRLKLYATGRTQ